MNSIKPILQKVIMKHISSLTFIILFATNASKKNFSWCNLIPILESKLLLKFWLFISELKSFELWVFNADNSLIALCNKLFF